MLFFLLIAVINESGPRRGDIPWQWNYYKRK